MHKKPSNSGRNLELVNSKALDQSMEEVGETHHLDSFHVAEHA